MKSILIIDDEEKLRGLLARIIKSEGFEVFEAGDLKSGFKKLEHNNVDVVLCDVKLPDGNGVDFVRKIKSAFPLVEVILLTAFGKISDGVQAMKNGAFDYIVKGDDNERIIANLTEQIQADSFIDIVMKKRKPKDAVVILGVTEHDIYNPKYNYLFGISGLNDGIGLVSTFRLIDYGSHTKYNIRKVVSKQIANMFSIANVKDYKCVLNCHDNESALMRGEFDISPRALEKLKFAIGFDY